MITMTLAEITSSVQGELLGIDAQVSGVGIDTRSLGHGDLYIAIQGERFDGHDFIAQAEASGAVALMVNNKVSSGLSQIIVVDTRIALAELASTVRERAQVKVCAITGSNGKTTVKEMIAAILAVRYQVLFTPGNFNNDIGVPLTLLQLTSQHEYAVIEMGANHAGEIAYSCLYAKPQVAVITNVGAAHIEGFGSIAGVAQAKGEIIESLPEKGTAVLNADDAFFTQWQQTAGSHRIISFALASAKADVRAENIRAHLDGVQFNMCFDLLLAGKRVPISLRMAGEHNVLNALAASAVCFALGVDVVQIQQGLKQVRPVHGRLQISIAQPSGATLINDTYNANPNSLAAALQVLAQCNGERWLVLGAFAELGTDSAQQHSDMAELIQSSGVKRVFAVGAMAENTVRAFGDGATFYTKKENLIADIQKMISKDIVLLVKGSRAQKMETVVHALMNEAK